MKQMFAKYLCTKQYSATESTCW